MIESTFGLLCARWRILLRPIEAKVDKAELIVQAVVCLHNFLIDELGEPFSAAFTPADATQQCPLSQAPMQRRNAHRVRREAEEVRARIIEFVNGVGAVEWQEARALIAPTQADDEDASEGEEPAADTQDVGAESDASVKL
ncbi:hypothetical protein AAVH_34409 [Aphelenchoides avenae]|nr:hypothetical protein AAVH_34409 [Aphelenchus avenae]